MNTSIQFRKNLLSLVSSQKTDVTAFYQKVIAFDPCGLFEIKERNSDRFIDIGPLKTFYFIFDETKKESALSAVADTLSEFIRKESLSSEVNIVHLLLLLKYFDDHFHDDPFQTLYYETIGPGASSLLTFKLMDELQKIDWRQNIDVEDPKKISDWDSLFRSFSYMFRSNALVSILEFSVPYYKGKKISPPAPLLKGRLLFELDLNSYLNTFQDEDLDFIFSYLFSRFAPHFGKESSAISIIEENIKRYSDDSEKFQELVEETFGSYYYKNGEVSQVRDAALGIVGKTVVEKMIDSSFKISLKLNDFIIYPRLFELFKSERLEIDEQIAFDYVTKTLSKTLEFRPAFIDTSSDIGFPYESLSNSQQEVYATILYSVLKSSDDVFKEFEASLKRFSYSLLPYYLGRYSSKNYAIRSTSNLFLMILSATWLTMDLKAFESRFRVLLVTISKNLLPHYTLEIVGQIDSSKKKKYHLDEKDSFFYMMDVAKKKNVFNTYTFLSSEIKKIAPVKWPWEITE